jgi:hypothetical protein
MLVLHQECTQRNVCTLKVLAERQNLCLSKPSLVRTIGSDLNSSLGAKGFSRCRIEWPKLPFREPKAIINHALVSRVDWALDDFWTITKRIFEFIKPHSRSSVLLTDIKCFRQMASASASASASLETLISKRAWENCTWPKREKRGSN